MLFLCYLLSFFPIISLSTHVAARYVKPDIGVFKNPRNSVREHYDDIDRSRLSDLLYERDEELSKFDLTGVWQDATMFSMCVIIRSFLLLPY